MTPYLLGRRTLVQDERKKERESKMLTDKDRPFEICRRCIGRPVCCFRAVTTASIRTRDAQDVHLTGLTKNGIGIDEYLWEDGRWAKGVITTDMGRRTFKKWSYWRERCSCCGKTWLVFLWGRLRMRVNRKCEQPLVKLKICHICKKFVRKELGDRVLLSGKQLAALENFENGRGKNENSIDVKYGVEKNREDELEEQAELARLKEQSEKLKGV
jgi:hypothetical protein